MLFTFFRCPKCNLPDFSPDLDLTLETYMKNEYCNDHMLILPTSEPPTRPNYLMFKCTDRNCNEVVKLTEEEILKKIIDEWSKIAWYKSQKEIRDAANVENYFTRHLLDRDLHKFINEKDIQNNPLIRDYIKAIENEEAKHIKKSNS